MVNASTELIFEKLTQEEKLALADWLEELVLIKDEPQSRFAKLTKIGRTLKRYKSLWPIFRELACAGKRLGWDQRKGGFRTFVAVSLATIVFFGFQGAGIAAF